MPRTKNKLLTLKLIKPILLFLIFVAENSLYLIINSTSLIEGMTNIEDHTCLTNQCIVKLEQQMYECYCRSDAFLLAAWKILESGLFIVIQERILDFSTFRTLYLTFLI